MPNAESAPVSCAADADCFSARAMRSSCSDPTIRSALADIQANRTVIDDGTFYGGGKNLH